MKSFVCHGVGTKGWWRNQFQAVIHLIDWIWSSGQVRDSNCDQWRSTFYSIVFSFVLIDSLFLTSPFFFHAFPLFFKAFKDRWCSAFNRFNCSSASCLLFGYLNCLFCIRSTNLIELGHPFSTNQPTDRPTNQLETRFVIFFYPSLPLKEWKRLSIIFFPSFDYCLFFLTLILCWRRDILSYWFLLMSTEGERGLIRLPDD